MTQRGFTLVELMITVAILAIIAAVAIPAYNGYIRESRLGAMRMNLDTLRIAVEAFRLDSTRSDYGPSKTYVTDKTKAEIDTQYGWRPEGDQGAYVYTVTAVSAATPTYSLIAEAGQNWVRCEKSAAAFDCCDPYDGSGSDKTDCK